MPQQQEAPSQLATRQESERLALVLEVSGMGDWSWDAATDLVTLSDRAAEIFGVPPGPSITWDGLHDLLHEEDREPARLAFERTVAAGDDYDLEYRVRRPDGSGRWVAARARLQRSRGGDVTGMIGVAQDITDRRRAAEAAEFLASAGAILTSSLDRDQTLAAVARLAVPRVADWCAVHLVEDDGSLRLLAAAHIDPDKVEQALELSRRYPPDPDSPHGTPNIARTGRTEVEPEITDEMLARSARDPEHLRMLRGLQLRSYIGAPVIVRGRTLAVITFISSTPGLRYGPGDIALAEELARRTAIGMDNAMLYAEAQDELARRAAAEAALRESEEKLRLALRASSMGTWTRDVASGRVEWSEELESIVGIPPGSFEGTEEAFFEYIHPEDRQTVADAVREAVETGTEYETEFRFFDRDGNTRWMIGRGRAFFDSEGALARLAGIGMDITDRKHAVEALRESEQRFRTMADSAPVLIWTAGADGLRDYFNKPWLDFVGRPMESQLRNGWTDSIHPDDLRPCVNAYLGAFSAREPFKIEFRLRRRDGAYRWVLDHGIPLFAAKGVLSGYIGSCIDITDRRRTEEQLRDLTERLETRVRERTAQLEDANRELESFSYSVSHDLRAPLRHIAGFADLLRRRADGSLDETGLRYIKTIVDAASHAGQLVDDLLMFSRMGRSEMGNARVDLARIFGEVRDELTADAKGRAVEWRIGPLPEVRGDGAMLRLVVRNLLDNAVKYTGGRDPAIIEVGAEQANGEAVFFVRDNGVGFDMQYADKLFGVFQRLHTLQEFEGTGIGLATVRRIIARHGGRTWAKAVPDRGATFFFSLPYAPGKEARE